MTRPSTLFAALLLAFLALPINATNTSSKVDLEVVLHGGKRLKGPLKWKKTHLRVRSKKVPYRDISSIERVDSDPKELLEQFEKRSKSAQENPKAWGRLARWAIEHGLYEQASLAYAKAVELDPEDEQAREGSGQVKDPEKGWVPVGLVLAKKRRELKPGDHAGLVDLARFARKHGAHEFARDLCIEVLLKDTYQEDALRVVRPALDVYEQKVKLRLPVAGRWKASEDTTRHHQKKGYALFALDLIKVDEKGRHHRGRGKELEEHYAWDAPFYAVADGTVVEVREGHPDNPIGKIGDAHEKHNGVSIDHGDGEMSWYVHAKNGSVKVKTGQKVKRGELLGTIGNSGGSAIPHLHFTLISFRGISVPWRCEEFEVIAPDGTPIRVVDMWPREGWIIRAKEPGAK